MPSMGAMSRVKSRLIHRGFHGGLGRLDLSPGRRNVGQRCEVFLDGIVENLLAGRLLHS
jgi:hypothetical protein